jgi:hypothetical protein
LFNGKPEFGFAGGDMKRFLLAAPMLFLLITTSAFADTLIGLVPNDGGGDNFGFLQRGGGTTIEIGGGTPFTFFHIGPYAPGSTLGGSTDVFFSGGFIKIGGNSHDLQFISGPGTLFLSSFTLPTNGKDFTISVVIDFSTSVVIVDTGQTLDVSGGRSGTLSFHFSDGFYFPDSNGFTVTPEPSTLGLLGTGLIGILAFVRKKRGSETV